MASPLTFLRPFRHESVRSVLLLQSAPIDLTLRVAHRLRTLFPGCPIEVVVREDDRTALAGEDFARVMVVRWEERREVVRTLRRQRYDAVIVPMSHRGSDYLRALPLLLRVRTILVFNDNLDYFPLHASRIGVLAHHVSGQPTTSALLIWLTKRSLLGSLATLYLLVSTARLELRARWRRVPS
ncbi:MAG: hypothetical protein HY271_02850 [Deltaproteobacteria bacterium]|nr:hypothetical protein [Deltaproteobacteria bacterium]